MDKNIHRDKVQYDIEWLDYVIENKKVKRCTCGLLKSREAKKCPHLQVMEIPEELKLKHKWDY